MTILMVDNLGKSFGADPVFSGVSFTIGRGEKAGLVGPNGAGKTTLLEVIAGRIPADEGQVHLVGGPQVGYLEQEVRPLEEEGPSLLEYTLGAMTDLSSREQRLGDLEHEMAGLSEGDPRLAELMEEYGTLRDAYEREGGYTKEARAREVLFGLGFTGLHLDLPLERLSGGQRTRARLARLLLEAPDLLLLDEPTNHLDLEAVEWLEDFLGTYPGAVLAVSHDRYFLDATVSRILELEDHRLTVWSGSYSAYVSQKEQWLKEAMEAYERQREEMARLEAYVRRYKAGNRSTMAKSREKALARVQRLERPRTRGPRARLRLEAAEKSGREVLHLVDLGFAFEDGGPPSPLEAGEAADARGPSVSPAPPGPCGPTGRSWLFRGVSASVRRGRRVALVGRNGTGKTTLLEVITGRCAPTEGEARWGANVRLAYFAQGLDELDDSRTVLEEAQEATGLDRPQVRQYLGRFLFSGEDVFKPVSVLSGGERNRLVLACLIARRPNVLVLDEPTNHLDLPAREALEGALAEFEGTLIFVSHDRYFVERLASRIWELDAGSLVEFDGTYSEYRLWKAQERARQAGLTPPAGRVPSERKASPPPAEPPETLSKHRRARLERELADLEQEIEQLERRRGEIESLLADPDSYRRGEGAELGAQYRRVLAELEEAFRRWEKKASALGSGEA